MPKVGKRILKSSLAVFCCFLISFLRQSEGIVFYSCIAAVLCIQQDVTSTKKVGITRMKGTCVGGIIGMFVLLFEQQVPLYETPLLRYALLSVMIIVVIYCTMVLKMQSASYISCVVFMSITISHAFDVNPYLFAIQRIIDTLIGIFVAFFINGFHLPHKRHQDTLFVISLSHGFIDEQAQISAYTKVIIRQLLERGANITIMTNTTPGYCLPILQELPLQLAIIAMNGAVIYDLKTQEYKHAQFIDAPMVAQLLNIIRALHLQAFTATIQHEVLHVYYDAIQHPVAERYYHQMRKTAYQNYICHPFPADLPAVHIYVCDREEQIQEFLEALSSCSMKHHIQVITSACKEDSNYQIVEIYHRNTSKKQAIAQLCKEKNYPFLYLFESDDNQTFINMTRQHFLSGDEIEEHNEIIKRKDEYTILHKIEALYRAK